MNQEAIHLGRLYSMPLLPEFLSPFQGRMGVFFIYFLSGGGVNL